MQIKDRHLKNGIYLLPNVFTLAGLFAGFYSIVASLKHSYGIAAFAIFIAMLLDGFDGRIARMTGTESAFGAELDSLADMTSFGVAPALTAYSWVLMDLHKAGWLIAFIFAACAAMRLARFNTQLHQQSKKYFQGLPSPAAAGVIASFILFCREYHIAISDHAVASVLFAALVAIVGLLMVSRLRYYSFKEFNLSGRVPFMMMLLVLFLIVMLVWEPVTVLFFVFMGYALSGIIVSLYCELMFRYRRRKRLHALRAFRDQ